MAVVVRALAAVSIVACLGCGEPRREAAALTTSHLEQWDTAWAHRVSLEDTALISPFWLESFRGGVVVGNGGEPRITAFTGDGAVRWIYAPLTGDGPGEMRSARDAVESDDGLWVVGSPARLILLSDDGRLLRQLTIDPVPGGVVSEIELVGPDVALITVSGKLARVSLVDGRVHTGPDRIAWTREPPQNWFFATTLAGEDGLTAVGMLHGPEVLVLENDSIRASIFREEISYRPGVPLENGGMMPTGLPGQIPFGAWQLRLVDRELWVLTGGSWLNDRWGIDEPRLNDQLLVYSREGVLLGRRTLPFDTEDFDVDGDLVYLLDRTEDARGVMALRRKSPQTARLAKPEAR